jgi:hypothetical protein
MRREKMSSQRSPARHSKLHTTRECKTAIVAAEVHVLTHHSSIRLAVSRGVQVMSAHRARVKENKCHLTCVSHPDPNGMVVGQ